MSTSSERSDGSLLGFDHDIVSGAAFVYDQRGPRSSPAIEIQGWVDPPVYGSPADDPTALGIQALGVAVNDLEAARERLEGAKCTVVGRGRSQFGTHWVSMQDVTGVALDLVEESALAGGKSRLAHLRVASSDLSRSVAWYQGIGFEVLAEARVDGAAFLGMADEGRGRSVRLRLRAEPFEVILTEWEIPSGHGRHPENANHAGLFRAAVRVEDTRALYEALAGAGWMFDRAPALVELHGTPVPDMWICFLSDPDGVPFELVQRPASAFRS
jgi:catechol 2,3-dioxygenase-like lactoylglutathione lyase family enzyme